MSSGCSPTNAGQGSRRPLRVETETTYVTRAGALHAVVSRGAGLSSLTPGAGRPDTPATAMKPDISVYNVLKCLPFWSMFFGWAIAQGTKMLCVLYYSGKLDFSYIVSTGGMPSAHSAMVTALATSVGMVLGFASVEFTMSLAFALVVMFDASTVRRAAGQQARLLNEIVDELFKEHHLSERKLKELLGHTRMEVFMGLLMGLVTGIMVTSLGTLISEQASLRLR